MLPVSSYLHNRSGHGSLPLLNITHNSSQWPVSLALTAGIFGVDGAASSSFPTHRALCSHGDGPGHCVQQYPRLRSEHRGRHGSQRHHGCKTSHTRVKECVSVCVGRGVFVYICLSLALSVRYAERSWLMMTNLPVRKHTGHTRNTWRINYILWISAVSLDHFGC